MLLKAQCKSIWKLMLFDK